MTTFKYLILPHQRREDGSYNVKIRITQKRQIKYIKTNLYVSSPDITKRKESGKEKIKIKNQAIIDLMEDVIHSYKRKLVSAGSIADTWNVDEVYDYLTSEGEEFHLDFIKFGRELIEDLRRHGRDGTAQVYQSSINIFSRFAGESVDINDINAALLRAFERYIDEEPSARGSKLAPKGGRAVSLYFASLRAIHNKAKREYNDEDSGAIRIPGSPFGQFKIKQNQPKKKIITLEQMQKIIDLPCTGAQLIAKDYFLLSFAMFGTNSADFFSMTDYQDGVVSYKRTKTTNRRDDGAEIRIRIEPEIKKIFDRHRGKNRVFDLSDRYSRSVLANGAFYRAMHKIGDRIGVKDLSFYFARHAFATLAANKAKIDILTVDDMLNHSNGKLKMARVYIEKDFSILWEANRKVISLLDWSSVM